MSALSAFQTLPLHIAEAIAEYYIGTYRFAYLSCIAKDERQCEAWSTLYKVSSIWRALAIRYFYKEIALRLTAKDIGKGFYFTHLPRGIKRKQEWTYNYVRNVIIYVKSDGGEYDNAILSELRVVWNKDTVFPFAQHLMIIIVCPLIKSGPMERLTEDEILYWIAQHLPRTIPNLQRGYVFIRDSLSRESGIAIPKTRMSKKANTFFSTLFGKVKELDLSVTYASFDNSSNVLSQNFQGFTSLSVDCRAHIDIIYIIVKKSTLILESLELNCFSFDDLELLFYDDNNQAVTYPRLCKLKYDTFTDYMPKKLLKTDESVSLFPALTYLSWPPRYPFSDDTLFRGNSGTLRYLKIGLDKNFVNVLEKHKMFSVGRCPKLHYLTVCNSSGSDEGTSDLELFALRAISLLTPKIGVFRIINDKLPRPFAPYIVPSSSIAKSIQILDLSEITLEFMDMLNIIKLLPNMTDICCFSTGMLPIVDEELEDNILDLQTKYYPLSHRLRLWSLVSSYYAPVEGVALNSAILAILCTDFTFTAVPFEKRQCYHSSLSNVLKQPGLNKYAEKIKPLFRDEYSFFSFI